jgi:hypothetical protein
MSDEYIAHEETNGRATLKIIADRDASDPRKDRDCLAVMVCDHRRYTLGDEDAHGKAADAIRASRDYRASWEDEDKADSLDFSAGPDLYKAIQRCSDIMSLPLYLYDHSGITMSTGRFACPWDSGQVGFIFVTRERYLTECVGKPDGILTKARREAAYKMLEGEVEEYDQYLTGDVWGYVVEDEDGDQLDACWGFFGIDYAKEEGRSALAYEADRLAKADEAAAIVADEAMAREMEAARPDMYGEA